MSSLSSHTNYRLPPISRRIESNLFFLVLHMCWLFVLIRALLVRARSDVRPEPSGGGESGIQLTFFFLSNVQYNREKVETEIGTNED